MKKFLAIGFAFITPVIALCVTATLVEWNIFRRDVRWPDRHIAVCGDSLIGAGINFDQWTGIINFGQGTTQPVVWRAKLGVWLDENPQIDTFIVQMWSGILTRGAGQSSTERAQFSRGWAPLITLLDIFRRQEMGGLPKSGFARNFIRGPVCQFLRRCIGMEVIHPLAYHSFKKETGCVKDTAYWKSGFKNLLNSCGTVPDAIDLPVFKEYDDIFDELKRRNIRIVIITPPLMPQVRDKIMANGVREWSEAQISKYAAKYDAQWLNLLDVIPEPECYLDYVHLNFRGAECFTELLKNTLK